MRRWAIQRMARTLLRRAGVFGLEFECVEEALGGGARVAVGGWHEGRGIDGWTQVDDKNRRAHRKKLRRPRG